MFFTCVCVSIYDYSVIILDPIGLNVELDLKDLDLD